MSLNIKQSNFLSSIEKVAGDLEALYGECFNLYEDFQEDFQNGQDNALNDAGVTDDLTLRGYDYNDIAAFCNQACLAFTNYFTGSAVTTREYGKDIRKISN